jgi:Protein phosphatase 2C
MGDGGMTKVGWKYVLASVAGTSHLKKEIPCQDSSRCRVFHDSQKRPILVAVASDGAGSASHSELGSALACGLFVGEMETFLASEGAVKDLNRDFAESWLKTFQNEVRARAEAEGLTPGDFACTVLASIVAPDSAAFMQVGDGCIVVSEFEEPDEYSWVFWPQKGEFANMTTFATSEAASEHLEFTLVNQKIAELAVFTDGIERIALRFETQEVHAPFFLPMFVPLRPEHEGHVETLCASLRRFFNSDRINERTDDDKTLILATRCTAAIAQRSPESIYALPKDTTTL